MTYRDWEGYEWTIKYGQICNLPFICACVSIESVETKIEVFIYFFNDLLP